MEEVNKNEDTQNTQSSSSDLSNDTKEPNDDKVQHDEQQDEVSEVNKEPVPVVPPLQEDYDVLLNINLLKAVLIKFQRDVHPNKEINSVLERRIQLNRSEFEGPFAIRIISSLLMIFCSGTVAWIAIWLISSAFGETSFLVELSGAMAVMLAAMFGIAIFQPFHLIDEKALKVALSDELEKLKCHVHESNLVNNTKPQSQSQESLQEQSEDISIDINDYASSSEENLDTNVETKDMNNHEENP